MDEVKYVKRYRRAAQNGLERMREVNKARSFDGECVRVNLEDWAFIQGCLMTIHTGEEHGD